MAAELAQFFQQQMLEPLVVLAVAVAPIEQVKLVVLVYPDKAIQVVLETMRVVAVLVVALAQ